MRRMAGLVMSCVGCGSAMPQASGFDKQRDTIEVAQRFVAATSKHDITTVRSMFDDSVSYGGLWFSDPVCRTEFHQTGDVTGPRLDVLARCLAMLDLQASPRRDALHDVAVLSDGPGFEIEARFADDHGAQPLSWIGYAARLEGEGMPTVSAKVLEALRVAGDRDGPVDGLDPAAKPRAWLKVCVDAQGTVTDANVRETTSTVGAQAFLTAARAWRFQPFLLEGSAVPVCAMFAMKYPATHAADEQEVLPLPLPMRHDQVLVPQSELRRISGEKVITPDDETKRLIHSAGLSQVVGAFKLCLDTEGHVSEISTLRSTRSRDYDAKLISHMRSWTYEPLIIDGKPKKACTAITFIYTQR